MVDTKPLAFKRHRFPPGVIRYAVWLYFRFTPSLRDVEYLLAKHGVDMTYETIRCCADKFGPAIAANIRERRHQPGQLNHNNRAENSHFPVRRRERKMQLFKS